jgi:hypothetical protein
LVKKVRDNPFCYPIFTKLDVVRAIMENNDQDPELCSKLSTLMSNAGYTPIQETRKAIPLRKYL